MNIKDKFKVGDRVRISESSGFYGNGRSNPSNCEGTVTKKYTDHLFTIDVDWDNGEDNSYRDLDLELVTDSSEVASHQKV